MVKFYLLKFKDLLISVCYHILLLTLAFIFDRFYQMLMFVLFFETIHSCFTKRFHSDTLFPDDPIKAIKYCKIITIAIEIIYLFFCKSLSISLYSNLFVIFIIAFGNSLLQFYLERTIVAKVKLSDLESLLLLCKEAGLTELATNRMKLRYIDKKSIKEIALLEVVEEKTIEESLRRSKRKLKL